VYFNYINLIVMHGLENVKYIQLSLIVNGSGSMQRKVVCHP